MCSCGFESRVGARLPVFASWPHLKLAVLRGASRFTSLSLGFLIWKITFYRVTLRIWEEIVCCEAFVHAEHDREGVLAKRRLGNSLGNGVLVPQNASFVPGES